MSERNSFFGVAGLTTGLAIVLALLRGGQPERPVVVSAARSTEKAGNSSKSIADVRPVRSGAQLLGEYFFGSPAAAQRIHAAFSRVKPEADESAGGAGETGASGGPADTAPTGLPTHELRTLIVTLPDPVDSHLDWAYDAGLEAVRRAVENSRYVIDRFALPWPTSFDTASAVRAGREAPARAKWPGVMLFRGSGLARRNQLLLVYVVSEVPTAGLYKDALRRALAERDALVRAFSDPRPVPPGAAGPILRVAARERDTVRIVGPFFTGSARSLRLALDARRAKDPKAPVASVVTGAALGEQVPDVLAGRFGMEPAPAITVRRTSNSAKLQMCALMDVLTRQLHIGRDEIALLREGTTSFGADVASSTGSIDGRACETPGTTIPFPINISSLRAEYARQPMPSSADGATGRTLVVPLDLSDSSRAMENPVVMSRDLTAASAEIVLDDIARTLVEHRIRAVGIVATDVRDKMFLGTELRRRMRDVQLFTTSTNTLLLRSDRNRWLRGMLVAATYPLAFEGQFWDAGRGRERMTFTSDLVEAVYNAVALQLAEPNTLTEYGVPLDPTMPRPPVWVTVVGERRFVPLTARQFDTDRDPAGVRPAALATPAWNARSGQRPDHSPGDEMWQALALCALAIAGAIWSFWQHRRERDAVASGCLPPEQKQAIENLGIDQHAPRPDEPRNLGTASSRYACQLRRVLSLASLARQWELYAALRFVSLFALVSPALLVTLHHRPFRPGVAAPSGSEWVAFATWALLLGIGMWGVWGCLDRVEAVERNTEQLRQRLRNATHPRSPRLRWARVEAFGRGVVLVAGVAYLLATALLVVDVLSVDGVDAVALFARLAALDSGVSPVVPLIALALVGGTWCLWNSRRTALLMQSTAFEEACVRRVPVGTATSLRELPAEALVPTESELADARPAQEPPLDRRGDPEPAARAGAAAALRLRARLRPAFGPYEPPGPETGGPPGHGGHVDPRWANFDPPWLERDHLSDAVGNVRARITRLFPTRHAVVLVVLALGMASWIWRRFAGTLEATVLTPWLGLTAFDWIFRTGIIATIVVAAAGLQRFWLIWQEFRRVLEVLATLPLVDAFRRLPVCVGRVARLTPTRTAVNVVDHTVATRWEAMARHGQLWLRKPNGPGPITSALLLAGRPPVCGALRVDRALGAGFVALYAALLETWAAGPATAAVVDGEDAERRAPDPRADWLHAAEECLAAFTVAYVEWVFRQLRALALCLLITIVLTTTLLSSYPFQPQSLVRVAFFAVLVTAVATLIVVATEINRDEVLSALARTEAGKVNLDASFLMNVALFGAVPVITLVSAEFPEVREFLFSWLTPLVRTFGSG